MAELVSVVVLSYSRPALLRQALAALSQQTYGPLQVIVVDNRSDRSEEVRRVVESFPLCRLIQLPTNIGFTGGMDAGIRLADGAYTLLTEDDIVLEPDCIHHLVVEFSRLPKAGLASGTLTDIGRGTLRYAGGEVRLGRVLRLELPSQGEPDRADTSVPRPTGYIPGCFVFGRTQYLQRLGPFRPDFFMYQEDIEMCLRVLELGDKLWFIPRARCGHHDNQPSWNQPEVDYHKLKNSLAVYALHAAPFLAIEYWLRFCLQTVRTFRSDARVGLLRAQAIAWALSRTPSLWVERRRRMESALKSREHAKTGAKSP